MTATQWRMIPHHPAYEVSRDGRVRRRASGHGARPGLVLSPQVHKSGYLYVHLWEGGKRTAHRVHRLVAEAWIGPIPEGYEVNHRDGDRANNHVDNLEIVTPSQNVRHSYVVLDRDPAVYGERHHHAKLTVLNVRRMRAMWPDWKALGRTQAALGEVFGVSDSVVSRVVNGAAWQHIQSTGG